MNNDGNVLLVTASDAGYFDFLHDLVLSLEATGVLKRFTLAIFDCGLSDEQISFLQPYTKLIVKPGWDIDVPPPLRKGGDVSRVARPFIPKYFPGYDYYVWVDADMWLQDGGVIDEYLEAARETGFSVVKERERAYRIQPWLIGWTVKNFIAMYGLRRGLYLCACTPINAGLFAMKHDAPHWQAWIKYYTEGIRRSNRLYNQFSLVAAIHLDRLPVTYMKGTQNWICSRGLPKWDSANQLFCVPYATKEPIKVMHLAGPAKTKTYEIRTLSNETVEIGLRFSTRTTSSVVPG